jgi:iron complex outermembrane receptor protein
MKKLQFNHMLALLSTMTLVAGSQTVYAQQAAPDAEEIVITGFKASLEKAQELKKASSSIVEAIAAEDIGKLPDSSIAESLARLPGLAGERRDGRTSGLSVRGFNENYVATTMNGREILGIGDNRGVEYDLYPSEIISGATIYKTPDATLVNQGLGGIVNLSTIRPLDHAPVLSISGNYEQNGLKSANPDFKDTGYRLAGTYSDKFADDTIGVAISVATMESPSQEEQFRAWGYPDVDFDKVTGKTWNPDKYPEQASNPGNKVTAKAIGGQDTNVRSSIMKRDTFSGVFQYRPNEKVEVTVDALHIDFNDDKVFRGYEEGFAWGGGADNTYNYSDVVDGLATTGTTSNFASVIRNDGDSKEAKLDTFGLNVKYHLSDDWALTVDVATGKSEKNQIDMESYSGVGRAPFGGAVTAGPQGAKDARSWTMTSKGAFFSAHPTLTQPDYSNAAIIKLAGPQAWGGGASPAFGGRNDQQDGFVNNPHFEEELNTLRLQASGNLEFSIVTGVEFGFNYSDRTKSKVNYGAFLTSPEYYAADGVTIDAGDGPVPAKYITGVADLGVFGLGKMLAYDGIQMYRDGYYKETPAALFETGRLGDTYTVDETVSTLFGMAKFETGILTGNVGLQIISTDQSATGYATQTKAGGYVQATPVSDGAKYVQWLPSLNMNFQVADDQVVRFATSKTQSRSRMDDMRPNSTIGFSFDTARRNSTDPLFSAWSASSGNSTLKPTQDVQFDLSYEWYFAEDGLLSAAYFYKDLQSWNLQTRVVTDFTNYIIPGYHDVFTQADIDAGKSLKSTQGVTTANVAAGSGYVAGTEFQANIPLRLASDYLDGLGINASAAFMDGEIDNNGTKQAVPGLSSETYQLTVYFEHAGFEARVSARKRDAFLSETQGLSLALTPGTDLGATLVDAQIGYNFANSGIKSLEGLTITLQGQNLTNESTVVTEPGDSRQIDRYQNFGANYLLGFNYKF